MIETILSKVIMLLIVMGILYFLYKKGVLKSMPLPFMSYSDRKGRRSLTANFQFLAGAKVYNYMLKQEEPITFYYDVAIDKGSLKLTVKSNSGDIFDKVFTAYESGSIEIMPKTRLHSIVLNGDKAKGRCHCEFKVEK